MREVAGEGPWQAAIGDASRLREPRQPIEHYYDLLAPKGERVDAWHTVYQHVMASADAIVEWVSATGLRPFVAPLSPEQREGFVAEYTRRIDAAYPARTDGRRLLAFPRLFVVARKPGGTP
jgi:trans-aconitate 2-methyltransferase